MEAEQIALIGGLVVGGIGAASGLMAPFVAWINARSDRRSQRTHLWISLLKERIERLTELQAELEILPPTDETRSAQIATEIRTLVISTGYSSIAELWLKAEQDMARWGSLTKPRDVKRLCDTTLQIVGQELIIRLEIDSPKEIKARRRKVETAIARKTQTELQRATIDLVNALKHSKSLNEASRQELEEIARKLEDPRTTVR